MQTQNKILKTVMKPITELVILTDKFSDWIFDQKKISDSTKMFEGVFKGKKISSTVTFKFGGGLLQQFDKSVLLALINERNAENEFVSIQRLFETLGGGNHLTSKMKTKLLKSVRKLMATIVKIDCVELVNLCYKGKKATIEGPLLHCNIITAKINSQVTDDVIQLVADSPLLQVADIKNQIARLPSNFLPKIRSTENLIALNWFLLEQVAEIVGSNSRERKKRVHKLNCSILFDTLFNKCGFSDLDKIQKSRLRENIKNILEHFQNCGLIEDFKFTKENGEIRSIEIFLS